MTVIITPETAALVAADHDPPKPSRDFEVAQSPPESTCSTAAGDVFFSWQGETTHDTRAEKSRVIKVRSALVLPYTQV